MPRRHRVTAGVPGKGTDACGGALGRGGGVLGRGDQEGGDAPGLAARRRPRLREEEARGVGFIETEWERQGRFEVAAVFSALGWCSWAPRERATARMQRVVEAVDRVVEIEPRAREDWRGASGCGQGGGRRGAAAASAALPFEQEAKEWRQGARYPGGEKAKGGGGGKRALLLPFWEERDENEPRLTVLDACGMGRRAREDDAGDDCKRTGTV